MTSNIILELHLISTERSDNVDLSSSECRLGWEFRNSTPQPLRVIYDRAADSDSPRTRLELPNIELICTHRKNRKRYFLCPYCGEMRATVNPRNNLAHCFCCGKNFNNIDLLIELGYDFRSAAAILEGWLIQYKQQQVRRETAAAKPPTRPPDNPPVPSK